MITEEPKKIVEDKYKVKCNIKYCSDIECEHYGLHDKNSNCKKICVHGNSKCV